MDRRAGKTARRRVVRLTKSLLRGESPGDGIADESDGNRREARPLNATMPPLLVRIAPGPA